jgi:hypothetical protein
VASVIPAAPLPCARAFMAVIRSATAEKKNLKLLFFVITFFENAAEEG